jgi:hypothetical protein
MRDNIQKFREDDFSKAMLTVASPMWRMQQANTWRLQDEFAQSVFFGEFLWDNNLFDLARYFSREYWAANYRAILSAIRVAGTFESYLTVLYSAVGYDAEITFEVPDASHLRINVNPGSGLSPWEGLMTDGQLMGIEAMHSGALEPLEFAHSTSPLVVSETIKLIEHLTPNGVFVEVHFQ